ncbi:MAG: DoxX family protein [Tannerellaceae bacterium]
MKYKELTQKVLVECCRLLIGVVFIFSGTVKAVDPMGGAIKISEYFSSFGLDKLQPFTVPISFNLAAAEFALGICMLLGVYRRYTSILILLFMAFMTPLTLYLALFDPVSDCGCFGDVLVISNWQTFYKNIVLLAAAVIVFIYNQRLLQGYTYKVYWFVALYSFIFCAGFAYRNYSHLPIIDFRPYKIGNNIPALMTIPEGKEADQYHYSFIYEKNGVKKEFSIEDCPAKDSTWTFVESKTALVKKGYTPPIAFFNIFNAANEDVTEKILNAPHGILLLIIPKVETADDEQVDQINGVYDYALDKGIPFYCITGSSLESIAQWSDNTGAEYPFLMADEVLLKTMIRSNPGLMLLRSGTVLAKWHYNNIPAEEVVNDVMDSYLNGTNIAHQDKEDARLTTNLLSFTVPLLLVWMYDYLLNRHGKRKRRTKKAQTKEPDKKEF